MLYESGPMYSIYMYDVYIYIGTCFFSGGPRVPWQFGIHNTDVFYLHAAASAGPHKCSFIYYTFVYNTQYIVCIRYMN